MTASVAPSLSQFATDVEEGLTRAGQKQLSPRYFYDELGSTLFEAITLLPEYGLTRADERLLTTNAHRIAAAVGTASVVTELGSGSGRKTKHVLSALRDLQGHVLYRPIDVSQAALQVCEIQLQTVAEVDSVCADWMQGLEEVVQGREGSGSILLLFLGSSIGNLERADVPAFLSDIRRRLRQGDHFLLGVDLVKNVRVMIDAYDDPIGVTAAFNLNLLGRMNRELAANFELRQFAHEVRWAEAEQRIEMHLRSVINQTVRIGALNRSIKFKAGETIWTESSHKFTEVELAGFARSTGFDVRSSWIDTSWPFAEVLWRAV